jgi:hypothetical protein
VLREDPRSAARILALGGLPDRGEADGARLPVAALLRQREHGEDAQQGVPVEADRGRVRSQSGGPVAPAFADGGGADPVGDVGLRMEVAVAQDGQGEFPDDGGEVLTGAELGGDPAPQGLRVGGERPAGRGGEQAPSAAADGAEVAGQLTQGPQREDVVLAAWQVGQGVPTEPG